MIALNDALLHLLTELKRQGGKVRDRELYENVKKLIEQSGGDISRTEFNKLLMMLEVRGYIRVEQIRKNSRMIYLAKENL